jgi:hypothetical protein
VIDELRRTLVDLVERKHAAPAGSAERAFIVRQITGIMHKRMPAYDIICEIDRLQSWEHSDLI